MNIHPAILTVRMSPSLRRQLHVFGGSSSREELETSGEFQKGEYECWNEEQCKQIEVGEEDATEEDIPIVHPCLTQLVRFTVEMAIEGVLEPEGVISFLSELKNKALSFIYPENNQRTSLHLTVDSVGAFHYYIGCVLSSLLRYASFFKQHVPTEFQALIDDIATSNPILSTNTQEREQYISIIEEYSVFNRLPKEFQDSFTPEHQLMIDELAIPMQSIVVLDPQEPAEIDVSLRILQAFLETNPNLPITPSPALAKFPQSEIPSIINCCSQCTTPLPCAPFRLTSLSLVPEGIKGCKTLAEKLVSEYTLEILASFHDSPENCANHIALLSPHVSSLSAFIGPFSPPNTIPEQSISAVIFDAILSSFLSPTYRALSVSHHLFSSAPELYTISVLSRWVKTETKIHTCVAVALFGCGNSVRWMDPFSKDAIIRWSAHHISQYNWQFAYQVWAKFISLPLSNPRRIFIESFFGACLNLCEVKSLKTAVPESLSVLLPTVFSFTPLMDHLKQLEDNKSSTNDISSDEPEQTDTSDEDPITKEKHSVEDAASTEKPTASEEQAEQVSQENTSQFLSSFIHIHSKVIKEILPSLATHFSTTTTPASKDAFATTFSSFPSFTSLASTEQKPLSIVLVFAALFEAGSLSVSHFLHHLRLSYSPIISIMDECTSVSPVHPHFIVLRLLCFLWGNSIESIVPIVWELLRLKVVSIPSVLQWVFSDSHSIVPLDSPLASLTTAPSFTEFLRPAVWRVIRQALSLHSTLLNKITLDISSKTGELNAASLEKMQSVLTRERNEFGNNIKLMLTVQDKLVGDIRLHEKNEIQQRDLIETIQRGVCSIIREFRSECVVSKDEIIAALGQLTHTQRVIEIIPFLL